MIVRFSRSPATYVLLALITLIAIAEWLLGAFANEQILPAVGAIVPHLFADRQYWRLITAMFLHANWLHWAANTWSLFQLGTFYETLFGTRRFLFMYFATGICASTASALGNHVSVGASGAIFGILGAFIFSVRRSPQYRHQPWTRSLTQQLVFWTIVNIGIGLAVPQIDNRAHIAGLVSGLLLGFIPHRVPPPPPRQAVIEVTGAPPPPAVG